MEIGGITLHAQDGNPKPRMFRSTKHNALINRMGFNNPGAEAVAQALQQWRARDQWPTHPIGINLGKSKVTPLEEAAEDYAFSFRTAGSGRFLCRQCQFTQHAQPASTSG